MKIGIIGGGQLGRMLALAGIPLGIQFRFWEQDRDCPSSDVGEVTVGSFDDHSLIENFVAGLSYVTYEFENVPVALISAIARHVPVSPAAQALEICQDRILEKEIFNELQIPCAKFLAITNLSDLELALTDGFPLPAILKSRRFGYDGKGQARIASMTDAQAAWQAVGAVPSILEQCVAFDGELSLISVRGHDGDVRFYPLIENTHLSGILSESIVPSKLVTTSLQSQAEEYGSRVLKHFNYVGVLTIEFFLVAGQLFANEMAPRVHNSGHWSIEGSETSQFANHIRALIKAPLGSVATKGHALLLNLVGDIPDQNPILAQTGAFLHLYRKSGRSRRKIGHITICKEDLRALDEASLEIHKLIDRYLQF
jgi:5-(carboxyamino)imidazole ribonucleotide synthase